MKQSLSIPTLQQLWRISWRTYIMRFDVILLANVLFALPIFLLVDISAPRELLMNVDVTNVNSIMDLWQSAEFSRYTSFNTLARVFALMINGMIVVGVLNAFVHKPSNASAVLRATQPFVWRVLVLGLLGTLAAGIGYVLLIVPGIVISAIVSLAVPVLAWNNESVWKAVKRSFQLWKTHPVKVTLYILVTEVLAFAVSALLLLSLPSSIGFTTAGLTIASIAAGYNSVFIAVLFTTLQGIHEVNDMLKDKDMEDALAKESAADTTEAPANEASKNTDSVDSSANSLRKED